MKKPDETRNKFSGNQGLLEELESLKDRLDAKQPSFVSEAEIPVLRPLSGPLIPGQLEDMLLNPMAIPAKPAPGAQAPLFPASPQSSSDLLSSRRDADTEPKHGAPMASAMATTPSSTKPPAMEETADLSHAIEKVVEDLVEGAIPLLRRQLRARVREMIEAELRNKNA